MAEGGRFDGQRSNGVHGAKDMDAAKLLYWKYGTACSITAAIALMVLSTERLRPAVAIPVSYVIVLAGLFLATIFMRRLGALEGRSEDMFWPALPTVYPNLMVLTLIGNKGHTAAFIFLFFLSVLFLRLFWRLLK
jgi:membrane-associated HD superfamily phosphohydrolase